MDTVALTRSIKEKALEIGFDLVGISPVGPFPESLFFKEWLSEGFNGEMKYMERNSDRREDVRRVFPEARSVISCGLNYNTEYPYSINKVDKQRGWISRYAWGDDYHEVIKDRLSKLLGFIREVSPVEVKALIYVDTGPVLERVYGRYGGIGWIGKNTCLINQKIGSWIFIGEIITNLELNYDSPVPDRCGTCRRCIDACPTGALVKPYVLDSRLCISYLTIELKGKIPVELREKVGNNVFGCDICQDVCPWNRRAKSSRETSFLPRESLFNPELSSLSELTEEDFKKVFRKSPVKRAKRRGFIRNVLVAMGNSGNKRFIPHVKRLLKDADPLVRAHAVWALWKLEGKDALETIKGLLAKEHDPMVREEILNVMNQCL
ncbi:MAG: epoxyqueuosine reductase [Deltaproteobacteria bacterium]|nr:MAG: epoxyqueuosine reductase [Deltaproteobacteria bacterium]